MLYYLSVKLYLPLVMISSSWISLTEGNDFAYIFSRQMTCFLSDVVIDCW